MAGAHPQPGFSLTTEKVALIHQRMSDAFIFNSQYADEGLQPAEIVWSAAHFSPRQIAADELRHLPAIICVESGFFGGGNIDCIASGQVAVVLGIYRQRRVLAIPLKGQGQHFSLPVLGYRHTFVPTGVPSNDPKGSTLDVLLKAHKLPVDVKFADNKLHQHYGGFTLVKQYDELYLYGHNIADGNICLPMVVIPVYLDITMSIGEGVVNGNANDWLLLKDIYVQESQRLLKDVIICGYMDMASFDSTWQQRDGNERPKSEKASDRGIGDQNSDEGDESGDDSSDGDDDHSYSYIMPSKYIKICLDLSADDSTSLSDDAMVKIEGSGGILSLTLNAVSRLVTSGQSRRGIDSDAGSSSGSSHGSSDNDGGRAEAGFVASGSGSAGKRPPVSARPHYVMLSGLGNGGSASSIPGDGHHVLSLPAGRGRLEDSGSSPGHTAANDKPNKPLPALPITRSTLPPMKTTIQESATPTVKTRPQLLVAKSTLSPTGTALQKSATPMVPIMAHTSAGQGESEQPPSSNRWPRVETQPPQRPVRAKHVDLPATTDHHPSRLKKPSGAIIYDRLPSGQQTVHGNATMAAVGEPGTPAGTVCTASPQLRATVTTDQSVTARTPIVAQQQPALATGCPTTAVRQVDATAECQVKASTGRGLASTPDQSGGDSDLDGYEEMDTVQCIAQAHVPGSKLGAASLKFEAPNDGNNIYTASPTSGLTFPRSIATAAHAAVPASAAMANRPLPVVPAPVNRSMSNPGQPTPSRDAWRASGRSASAGEVGSSSSSSMDSAAVSDPDAMSNVSGDTDGSHLQQAVRAAVPGCRVDAVPAAAASITTNPNFPMTLSDLPPGDLSSLTNEQLCRCLRLLGMDRCADSFAQDAMIDGVLLLEMTVTDLSGHFRFTEFEAKKIIMFARGWRPRRK